MDEQALGDKLSCGTVVGGDEIEAAIGQGGFGVVYRARHQHLSTLVALKEYLPAAVAVRTGLTVSPRYQSVASDYEDGLRRFKEEARRLTQFRSHPRVVTCLGFFEERGTAYLVMEYEEGLPLSELLTRREAAGRPLEQGELLRLAEQLLDPSRLAGGHERRSQAVSLHPESRDQSSALAAPAHAHEELRFGRCLSIWPRRRCCTPSDVRDIMERNVHATAC